jgi:hypothetical protein
VKLNRHDIEMVLLEMFFTWFWSVMSKTFRNLLQKVMGFERFYGKETCVKHHTCICTGGGCKKETAGDRNGASSDDACPMVLGDGFRTAWPFCNKEFYLTDDVNNRALQHPVICTRNN